MKKIFSSCLILLLLVLGGSFLDARILQAEEEYVYYVANPQKQEIQFFWKDEAGKPLLSLGRLKQYVAAQKKHLLFAMNGGMYLADHSPQGLFIDHGKELKALNTQHGNGNFHLKPNGVFYLTKQGKAKVVTTEQFKSSKDIQFATQSGPMLVIDKKIHPEFKKGSTRLNIRNGVGVLPNGQLLFAMSKKEVSLYDFANYFLQKGCRNALYLDGFVSRCYYPEKKWVQEEGDFGVMIGVLAP